MNDLEPRDRELVALGAALGSNCVPCVEYHVPEGRKAGLTDAQIHAAIRLADKVRQVPARKVLDAALALLPKAAAEPAAVEPGACGKPAAVSTAAEPSAAQPAAAASGGSPCCS